MLKDKRKVSDSFYFFSGTAGLDPRSNGKIASVAFIYIFITNLLGALIGVLSCLVFKPGNFVHFFIIIFKCLSFIILGYFLSILRYSLLEETYKYCQGCGVKNFSYIFCIFAKCLFIICKRNCF